MYEIPPDWQHARSRFNHDWLKNQYIPALEGFRNILDGQVTRVNSDQDFWEIDLPQWETHKAEAECLISTFEVCMSPRTLLNEISLGNVDKKTEAWVGSLVHTLWLVRLSVDDLTGNAMKCLKAANTAYSELKVGAERRPSKNMNYMLAVPFDKFRKACHDLARAFERFPRSVRIV